MVLIELIKPKLKNDESEGFLSSSSKYPLFIRLRSSKAFLAGTLVGTIIFPIVAHAGLLSFVDNLFVTKTEAASEEFVGQNSQKLALLEAQITPDPAAAKAAEADIHIDNDALLTETGPTGTAADMVDIDEASSTISIYVTHKGDTVASVAKMFDVSQNTILWANDIKKGQALTEGQTLIILPTSGVRYTVKRGDTIASIAKKYKIDDPADIENYNDLSDGLIAGTTIVLPGAEIATTTQVKKATTGGALPKNLATDSGISTDAYFIRPLPYACPRTQGRHDKYAFDIGCATGTPIHAAASGTVIFAKLGWNGGFGNLIIISHPNGTQTFYAHQSRFAVSQGEAVEQGQTIGYVGSTGHSTGPHLHFEVRGAKNPGFTDSPSGWKKQ